MRRESSLKMIAAFLVMEIFKQAKDDAKAIAEQVQKLADEYRRKYPELIFEMYMPIHEIETKAGRVRGIGAVEYRVLMVDDKIVSS